MVVFGYAITINERTIHRSLIKYWTKFFCFRHQYRANVMWIETKKNYLVCNGRIGKIRLVYAVGMRVVRSSKVG